MELLSTWNVRRQLFFPLSLGCPESANERQISIDHDYDTNEIQTDIKILPLLPRYSPSAIKSIKLWLEKTQVLFESFSLSSRSIICYANNLYVGGDYRLNWGSMTGFYVSSFCNRGKIDGNLHCSAYREPVGGRKVISYNA